MARSLYIHIPFCDQICSYCDFPKISSKDQDIDAYLDALIAEIEIYRKMIHFDNNYNKLKTVYIGGGTPTALTVKQLDKLFGYLHSIIEFEYLQEVSIEANPESLNDIEKINCLVKNGVTRVSLGVQTFQDDLLKILKRNHTKEDVIEVIDKLSQADIEINVDLIYSIPTQTLAQLEDDLKVLLTLPITHVSAYSLILEEHTELHIAYTKDELELLDNDLEATMFETVINTLTHAGFSHYEISNFTRGNRSFHNETYWKNEPYIGVGLGAHGQLKISPYENMRKTDGHLPLPLLPIFRLSELPERKRRYENTRSITAYKKALAQGDRPILNERRLSTEEQIEESMFLGLRLLEGVRLHALKQKYKKSAYRLYEEKINKLLELGYIDFEDPNWWQVIKLTKKGLMMANDVFEEFLL